MGAFRFSLEQVLRYRKQLEDQAMQVFAQSVQSRDKRLREKAAYEAAAVEYREKLTRAALLDADERWLITGYLAGLTADIERAKQDLVLLELAVDKARSELTQKAQERKLLERLKEKQTSRHHEAEKRKEQQNYDDIATIRFAPPAL